MGELQKAASMLVLDVHLEGEVTVPCDRCLADLVLPVAYDGRGLTLDPAALAYTEDTSF